MTTGTPAGFGRRLAALAYDVLLLAALLMTFTAVTLCFTHGQAVVRETAGAFVYLYRAGLLLVIGGYFVLNWVRTGQTLGMRAWRLFTVDEHGRKVGLGAALLRAGCAVIAWAPAGLGVLWLYLDSEHLALQDRLSRTRVLHSTGS